MYIDVHICTQRIHVDVLVLHTYILVSYLSPGHPGWLAPGQARDTQIYLYPMHTYWYHTCLRSIVADSPEALRHTCTPCIHTGIALVSGRSRLTCPNTHTCLYPMHTYWYHTCLRSIVVDSPQTLRHTCTPCIHTGITLDSGLSWLTGLRYSDMLVPRAYILVSHLSPVYPGC